MKFVRFPSCAALAVALILAGSAHAGYPDEADGHLSRRLPAGGNGKAQGNGNDGNNGNNGNGNGKPGDDEEIGVIVVWKNTNGRNELKNIAKDGKVREVSTRLRISALKTFRGNMKALHNNRNIESVEIDQEVRAFPLFRGGDDSEVAGQNEQQQQQQQRRLAEDTPYGTNMVKSKDVIDNAGDPAGSKKICVVDTGYALGHEDLPGTVYGVDGHSPYDGETWDVDGHGHGSHCAGTIGAIGDNGKGVTSVNPDPSRFSFFIGKGLTDSGSGTGAGVLEAVEACRDAGVSVISMSLGGGGFSNTANNLYNDLYENDDILIIAAAGNDGNSDLSYPASYNAVMSVAAVDSNKNKAGFSQYNEQVEIAAPGVAVLSTLPNDQYASWSGTSMATPHVAGVAALVWSYFPLCKAWEIRNALAKTAEDRGSDGCDVDYGYGVVDAKAAYDLIASVGCEADPSSNGVGLSDATSPKGGCERDSLLTCSSDSECVDSDPCTNDICDPVNKFCQNIRDPDCTFCGNNICEEGESHSSCPSDCTCHEDPNCVCHAVTLELLTDNYPGETSWQITDPTSAIVASGGSYSSQGVTATETMCFQTEGEYTFTIYDSFGDGICCSYGEGSYSLKDTVTEAEMFSGGEFSFEESKTFAVTLPTTNSPTTSPTSSPSSAPSTPLPSASPTTSPSQRPSSLPSVSPTSAPSTPVPTSAPTKSPTGSPTTSPTASPSSAPSTPRPTSSPTESPTGSPTTSPTASPSSAPSTPLPSASPTTSPSQRPSSQPTASPTPKPSSSPSTPPTDVNECLVDNGGCDPLTTCTNIPNGRICGDCPSGYSGSGEAGCVDRDECSEGTDNCHANASCDNIPGGYTCTCNAGYSGNGVICTDNDECSDDTHTCDANASCQNTLGSFTCSCNAGFTGDGYSCTNINECINGNNGGCDPLTSCVDTPGSYYCTPCPSGYTGTGESGCVEIVFAFTDSSEGFMVTSRASVDPDPAADSCWGYSAGDSDQCTRDVPLGATLHNFIWADWMVDPRDGDFRKAEYEIKVNGDRNKDVLVFVPDAVKGNSYQLHIPLDELSPVPKVGDTVTVKLKIELDSGAKLQTQNMPLNIVDLPPEPTSSPTKAPSGSPTTSPTKAPSPSPTTASPTASPSKAPSPIPTTGAPTETHSASPSNSPTSSPTKAPTGSPTPSPTKAPSTSPTPAPSPSPTTGAPTTSCSLPTGPGAGQWLIITTDGCTDGKVFDVNEDITLIFYSDAIEHSSVSKIEVEFKVEDDKDRKTKFKLDSADDLSIGDPSFPQLHPDGTYRLTIRMGDIGRIGGWDGGVTSAPNDPIQSGEWTKYKFKVEDAGNRHEIQRLDLFAA